MRAAPGYDKLPAAARRHLAGGDHALIYHPYSTATWRLQRASGGVLYLKAAQAGLYPSLAGERDRCLWLGARQAPVPEVVDYGLADGVEWLLTAALPGKPATAPEHLADPRSTAAILAEGLRAFHEIEPSGCPFDHTVRAALAHVTERVNTGAVAQDDLQPDHGRLSPDHALQRLLRTAPAHEDVVVCHGDYCFPNAMIHEGSVVGFLDLGEAGLADRWRDLAVATWSVTWNVGPGYEDLFLDVYGAELDLERRDFFRLLYDLES